MRNLVLAAAASVLAVAAAGAASAATSTAPTPVSMSFTGTPTSKDTAAGTMTYTLSGMSVTASAWTATGSGSSYTIAKSTLGQWNGAGMGVTAASGDASGSYGLHQVDNGYGTGTTSVDFLMLQFSKSVTLSSLSRNSYGVPDPRTLGFSDVWDNDFSLGYKAGGLAIPANLTQTTAGALPFTMLAGGSSDSCLGVSSGTCSATASGLGGGIYSNTWFVGASFLSNYGGDGRVDAFKLSGVTVTAATPSVPEPATWGMMILGFGVVGMGLRRRPAAAAKLA